MPSSNITSESIRAASALLEELLNNNLDTYLKELQTRANEIASILPDYVAGPKFAVPEVIDSARRLADRAWKLYNEITGVPAELTTADTIAASKTCFQIHSIASDLISDLLLLNAKRLAKIPYGLQNYLKGGIEHPEGVKEQKRDIAKEGVRTAATLALTPIPIPYVHLLLMPFDAVALAKKVRNLKSLPEYWKMCVENANDLLNYMNVVEQFSIDEIQTRVNKAKERNSGDLDTLKGRLTEFETTLDKCERRLVAAGVLQHRRRKRLLRGAAR
jgi:hypothetical protein